MAKFSKGGLFYWGFQYKDLVCRTRQILSQQEIMDAI